MKHPTTMILRFRDLSTNRGETIKFHKKKIDEHGYTWWGWWRKAHETLPQDTFQHFLNKMNKKGELVVHLFDTGSTQLYEARLTGIQWDTKAPQNEIESPEPQKSPEYYKGRKLMAWFKISEIGSRTKVDSGLGQLTYFQVDELFETKRSVFQDFYGKQVSSFEELKFQERTIWFVRPYEKSDATGLILQTAVTIDKMRPENFSQHVIDHPSPRLLWLSDIHFSNDHHAFPLKQGTIKGDKLSEAIRRDLDAQSITEVGGILITGDLTWRCTSEEFEHVRTFIDDVMSWSTLKPAHIVICPGNHDLKFSSNPWSKGDKIPTLKKNSKAAYVEFHKKLFGRDPDEHLSSGRRFLLARAIAVEVVSLNTSMLHQTQNIFQGHGFVGEDQLRHAANKMEWLDRDPSEVRPFRILMMHHHLVPVIPYEEAEYGYQPSAVYDAGSVCNWVVDKRIDLVLHGHMHHTKVVKESRSRRLTESQAKWHDFVIASLGSTSVKLSNDAIQHENVYGLLEFSASGCQLLIRTIRARDPDHTIEPTRVNLEIPYKTAS